MVTKASAQGSKRVAAAPHHHATGRRALSGPQSNLSILGGGAGGGPSTRHMLPVPPPVHQQDVSSRRPSAAAAAITTSASSRGVLRLKHGPSDVAVWRRWFCSDVALSKILVLLGSRITATAPPPETAAGGAVPEAPSALPLGALGDDRVRVAIAALVRALHLLEQSSRCSGSSEATASTSHFAYDSNVVEEVSALVDVAEAAVPFFCSVPARMEDLGAGHHHHHHHHGGEALQASLRIYEPRDVALRLANVRRVAVVRDAWQLGRTMRQSVHDLQQGLAAFASDAMRLRLRRGEPDEAKQGVPPAEAAGPRVVVALLDVSLASQQRSGRSSNPHRTGTEDLGRMAGIVAQLLTTACQPDPEAWGTQPGGDRSVGRPLCVDAALWFEVATEWHDVLAVALKQRELLGLPPFLRSVKRQQQQQGAAPVGSTTATSNPSGGVSLFPTVRHLDGRSFDLCRHVTGDYGVIDDELRSDVCIDALSFVAVGGDVDMMTLLLWDYLTCPSAPMEASRVAPYVLRAHRALVARRQQQQQGATGLTPTTACGGDGNGSTATWFADDGGAFPPVAALWVPGSQPLHDIPRLLLLFGVCEQLAPNKPPAAYLCAAMELRHEA